MAAPEKSTTSIVSKVNALVKDFADLKVHVVGSRDKRKSPTGARPNLWCTNCGKVGHANVECRTYPVNAVEWVPAWEVGGYYTDAPEEAAYAVQEGPPTTPIPPAQITCFVPKEMATTVPQRRLALAAAAGPPPPNACFNCGDVGHFALNCPHPQRPRGYVPICANCKQQGHRAVECNQPRVVKSQVRFVTPPTKEGVQVNQVEQWKKKEEKEDENRWPDEETMVGRVETRSSTRKKESTSEKAKSVKKDARKNP